MRLLFVTGRFDADSQAEAFNNVDRVTFAATRLMLLGFAVYVPLTAQHQRVPQSPVIDLVFDSNPNKWRQLWASVDAEFIKRCDGVYVVSSSVHDQRVISHINLAKQMGKQLFFEGVAEPTTP